MNKRILISVAFVIASVAANVITARFGFVPVGFGLTATAGTYAAGFCLVLRDLAQDAGGRKLVTVLILLGSALSVAFAGPALGLASGVAFLVSETFDALVYTPIRATATTGKNRWVAAVVVSTLVGAVVDTALFLWIAFGSAAVTTAAMLGQLAGKTWVALAVIALVRLGCRSRKVAIAH